MVKPMLDRFQLLGRIDALLDVRAAMREAGHGLGDPIYQTVVRMQAAAEAELEALRAQETA